MAYPLALAMPETKKTAAETASSTVNDMNSPLYCKTDANNKGPIPILY